MHRYKTSSYTMNEILFIKNTMLRLSEGVWGRFLAVPVDLFLATVIISFTRNFTYKSTFVKLRTQSNWLDFKFVKLNFIEKIIKLDQ